LFVGCETQEYLKDTIDELAAHSKNKNIRDLYRGINEFTEGFPT
jgi:predicted NACHT family NTPase